MAHRSRTSRKARALAATAGFALALTPAGIALADTSPAAAPSLEQPAQTSEGKVTTTGPSSATPAQSTDAPSADQVPATNSTPADPAPSTLDAPPTTEVATPAKSTTDPQTVDSSKGFEQTTPSPSTTVTPEHSQNTAQNDVEEQPTQGAVEKPAEKPTQVAESKPQDKSAPSAEKPAQAEESKPTQMAESKQAEKPTQVAEKPAASKPSQEADKPAASKTAVKPAPVTESKPAPTAASKTAQVAPSDNDASTGTPSAKQPKNGATSQKDKKGDATDSASQPSELSAQSRQAALKNVSIDAHVQNVGWTGAKSGQAGTVGQGLRMEAVRIRLVDEDGNEVKGVSYKAHVQDVGWTAWTNDGSIGGSTGKARRIEAIKISLSDELAKQYDIVYRVHVQNYGWLDWTANGAAAGTTGKALRIEAIGAYLQRKNAAKIGSGKAAFYGIDGSGPAVYLTSHVQNIGWSGLVAGEAGSTGRGLRLEAFTAQLDGVSGGITYNSHVQNVGWTSQVSNGAISGTAGKGLRIEAAGFKLTGEAANKYDIYYRAHVQDLGWLGWAKNGEGLGAGTQGLSKIMEAIQVRLVPKGGSAPSSAGSLMKASMVVPVGVTYASASGSSWQSQVGDGGTSGTYGSPLERVKASVAQTVSTTGTPQGGISYQVQSTAGKWSGWSSNGNAAGSLNTDARAIKFSLNGDLSKAFDVYYRAHVSNRGWLGWAANGADAGMTNSEKIDAINVVLVAKGNAAPSNLTSTYTTPVITPNWKSRTIDSYIDWAVGIAEDDDHGYSQYERWGPDYDCSSLVISSLKHAGLNTGSAVSTHNMKQELTKYGWEALPFTSPDDLQRGDILLNISNHTELYIGSGLNVGALISELGTIYGEAGDQTGSEITVKDYTDYGNGGWEYTLRLRG